MTMAARGPKLDEAVLALFDQRVALARTVPKTRPEDYHLDYAVDVDVLLVEVRRLRAALEQIAWMASAEYPLGVQAGRIARLALEGEP